MFLLRLEPEPASDVIQLEESEHKSGWFRFTIEHVNVCRASQMFPSASLNGYLSPPVPPSSLGYKNTPIFSHSCINLVLLNLT